MHTRVRGSSTACPHSTNDSTQCPSRFYYRDVLLFIHHGPLGDAGWQEAEVAPALPSPQPSVKTNAAPRPPSFIPPFFLSLLSFCFPPAHGLCQRRTKVEQALFSSSGRLVVLASKERVGGRGVGCVDEKVNNGRNGVHVNIIKRCHVWWTHQADWSTVFDAKLTHRLPSKCL